PQENIVMVVDGAGWHKTEFKLPANLKLHFLPPYSPELNPQEHVWDELREKWFHYIVFDSLDALEDQLVLALKTLEYDPAVVKSIAGLDWIINSVYIAN
ncbi:MAG: transposase, partial [Polaromonas sp.]